MKHEYFPLSVLIIRFSFDISFDSFKGKMLLQFHYQKRFNPWGFHLPIIEGHTWIITQPPYSHNFCQSKMAINNRALLYIDTCGNNRGCLHSRPLSLSGLLAMPVLYFATVPCRFLIRLVKEGAVKILKLIPYNAQD